MSAGSDRPRPAYAVSRLLLAVLGWMIFCRIYSEAVPAAWAWAALPAALGSGLLAARLRLRVLPAAAAIILFPLAVRLVFLAFSLGMAFDNGWLLTAPYWYLAALSTYLGRRFSSWRRWEIPVYVLILAYFLSGERLAFDELSVPLQSTLRLGASVTALVLAVVGTASAGKALPGKVSPGSPPADPAGGPGRRNGRGTHTAVLLVLLALLVFGGMRLRGRDALREGGGVLAGDLFRFDFNDVLSLEPEISLNSELTMLYREDGPPVYRYLRRYTLSGWDDRRGFFRDGDMETDVPGGSPPPVSLPRGPGSWETGDWQSRTPVDQEYYLIALDPSSFFALNAPEEVEPWVIWDDASFSRAYGVRSLVSVAGPWELYSAGVGELDPDWKEYYLRGGEDDGYRELARQAAGEVDGPWEQAAAIEGWFHRNYYYSLNPGTAPDGDQLSMFLYDTKRGYCSYYAFAMTRLCRSLGIPARVAVGFITDPETSVLGFVPVRSDQAHAWVEVWLDGFGWIEFDPTSQVMAPGEEYPIQFIDPSQWLPLVEEVLSRSGEISAALAPEEEQGADSWWRAMLRAAAGGSRRLWLLLLFPVPVAWFPGRILPGIRYLRDRGSPDPRRRCIAEWRHAAAALIRAGRGPGRNETAREWARRLESDGAAGFTAWTAIYLKAVFSHRFDDADCESAMPCAESLAAWRRGLSRGARLAAALGPGWKGGAPW